MAKKGGGKKGSPKNKTDKQILQELEKHPLLQGDGIHVCSDGTEVNFRTTTKNIRIKMMHLDPEEIDEVIAINSEYQSVRGQRTIYRRKVGGQELFLKNTHWAKALERSEEILDLFGKLYSGKEVHKIIVNEWKLFNVKYNLVLEFQRENADLIAKKRDEYQKDTSSVRLVHKRSRLDELSELYASRKSRYMQTGTKSDYELMLKTLEQIRKEVEGQVLSINGMIQVEHEMAIQDHINQEVMKTLNVNDIIIGRLCARLGLNPKYILYRLHTSYYKKFTGFLPEEMNDENEINYPSQIVYDFTRIAQLNKELDIEDAEILEETTEVDEKKKPQVNKMRQLLLKKTAEKRENLDKQSTQINNTDGK